MASFQEGSASQTLHTGWRFHTRPTGPEAGTRQVTRLPPGHRAWAPGLTWGRVHITRMGWQRWRAVAAAAVTAMVRSVRSALLSPGGGGSRRGGGWRARSRPQKEAPPSAGLTTNRINKEREKAPTRRKKREKVEARERGKGKRQTASCRGKGAPSDHPCRRVKANH